ncbi:hypothetical protein NC653_026957 [Populus alba x Populus x berolinensis]|uniref:Uncharacterized protein n=2 Tax=Populus TaxID=3689 RepID=A0A8X7YJY8_POPTO|nr:hypothetical protein POTOM_040420 [Populus tomentosa]KAJ6978668.1 hypothetical protein NC653_026957 [Populus alba x Populus x berolinensis]
MKEKRGKPVVASDRPGKGDKLHKHNIHHSDGDLDNLHVQPYKEFVKEEHWIQLANEDRSAAYICRLCFRIRLIKEQTNMEDMREQNHEIVLE